MNTEESPPGYSQHSLLKFNRNALLLPTSVVQALKAAEEASEFLPPNDEDRSELEKIVKMILSNNQGTTRAQLYDYLMQFSKAPLSPEPAPKTTTPKMKYQERYVQVFDMKAIQASKSENESNRSLQSILRKFKDTDDGRRLLKCVPKNFLKKLGYLKLKHPNCIEFLDYVEAFAALALKQEFPVFYFPPVLIVGPPGVGKTDVVCTVADLIGIGMRQIDLGSVTAGFVIGGMSSSWSDAKTGSIIDQFRDGNVANPIFILDEADKTATGTKYPPLGPLYPLLEQNTAAHFIDEALNIPTDVSHALYVGTANSIDTIPKPILSRFTVVRVEGIQAEQHADVTQSIYASVLKTHACQKLFAQTLTVDIIDALRDHSPRIIKTMLRRAIANAAIRAPKAKRLSIQQEDLLFSIGTYDATGAYDGKDSFGFKH